MHKTALKEKKEQLKKPEKNKKLDYLNEEFTQINHKSCLEEVIKEYNLESEKYALEAEQKDLELLKLSNGLKHAAVEKQSELDNY